MNLNQALANVEAERPGIDVQLAKNIDWKKVVKQLAGDPTEVVDFEKVGVGKNKRISDEEGRPGVKLTGDDAVKLKQGNFRRFEPFSISLSMMTPDEKQRAVIYHRSRAWTDAASRGYQLLIEDGRLSASLIHFWPGNAMRVVTKTKIPVKQWLDVAVVYDGSSRAEGLSIYVDGVEQPVRVVRDALTRKITGGGGDTIAIGERFRDRGFTDGQVSDFKVFNRLLSGLEVECLHDPSVKAELETGAENQSLSATQIKQLLNHYKGSRHFAPFEKWSQDLMHARKAICDKHDKLSEIMVMRELPEPRPAFVLDRGLYDQRREQVAMLTPKVLPPMRDGLPANRLGLAKWLTDPDHPLTARVAANHYWQLLFGEGIVRTPEDFGRQSALPTHPELLDWLANEFVAHDWDVKWLLKEMMMSATYQQSTSVNAELLKRDPDNELLARAPSFRLPAEMLRDNVLAVSGLLVDKIGGPPVRPYELAASFKPSAPDTGNGLYRRSLYTYWKRTGPAPVMLSLDAAKRDVCSVKRERTTSPLQALAMLNGPQFVEASRALAYQLVKNKNTDAENIQKLFRMLTSRKPSKKEVEILSRLVQSQKEYFASNPDEAKAYLTTGKFGNFAVQPITWTKNKHHYRLGGDQHGGSLYQGQIAQARIYKTKATQDDIRRWFQLGKENGKRAKKTIHLDLQTNDTEVSGSVTEDWHFQGGYLTFPKTAWRDPPTVFTMELWIKPEAMGGRLWDKITPGKGDGFLLDLYGGLRFICGGHTVMAENAPPLGKWSHVVVTVDLPKAEVAYFLNGKPNGRKKHKTAIDDVDLVELAAWGSVVNTLINHDECVTRR